MTKLERLEKILTGMESVVIAFSGGMDSSFLLKVAKDTLSKDDILAVTAVSDTYTSSELKQAKGFAKALGVNHKLVFTDEMKDRNFATNPPDRCYYCKKELFKKLQRIARRGSFKYILDASNLNDVKDYRPGSRAKREFGVRSPLQEAGIGKNDIRKYSRRLGLNTWNLGPMPCLASRIPYGQKIDRVTLEKIKKGESVLKSAGLNNVRLRCHNDIARIEVERKDIKRFFNQKFCDKIIRYIKRLGFRYITLDLEGYRTGSMNEVLESYKP